MQLGISTYTFTWAVGVPGYPVPSPSLDVVQLIAKAKAYGIPVVQVGDNIPLHLLKQEELDNIKEAAGRANIQLEVGTRGTAPGHLRCCLEICRYLKAPLLRTILQKEEGHVTIDEAAAGFREVLPEFAESGIMLAVENHERHRVSELVSLMEQLDSPHAGICLDTVNSFGALEGPAHVIAALAPYTVNLHVKDFHVSRLDHNMGFQLTGTPAGSGQLDLDFVMDALKRYGRSPNAVLELWTPYTGSIEMTIAKEQEWADQSIAFLKEWKK